MQNLLHELEALLKKEKRFVAEGKLLKNVVIEEILRLEPSLIKLLVSHPSIKQNFFVKIDGVLVFDKVRFQKFVSNKQFLPDSYTAFKNKIGLSDGTDGYLKEGLDVVLNWAYKDCVLEGGMAEEEQGRDEIFYNTILAPDEITRLFEQKVLTEFKKWDVEAVKKGKPKKVSRIQETDNLLIKGNNLLALHCIKERYRGKVKCIFIDPPYNTQNDSFSYNDRFNHSTWLTFMKNRLEVAKVLLKDSGLIFVTLDDNEGHYCKVLMDEIFDRKNFMANIIWNSTKSNTNSAIISNAHTNILTYAKNRSYYIKNRTSFRLPEDGTGFANPDNDPRGPWKADPYQVGGDGPNQKYTITNPETGKEYKPKAGNTWKNNHQQFKKLVQDNRIVFGKRNLSGPQRKRFLSEAMERGRVPSTLWEDLPTTTDGTRHLNGILDKPGFSNPKPEGLIERILMLATSEADLVLDFFAGSGTTLAVAHKMKRQWIGVEQIEYKSNLPEARMWKVIAGEPGGISESVKWQGGGSFISCELKKWNEQFAQEIKKSKSTKSIKSILRKMKKHAFIRYEVDIADFYCPDFNSLTLGQQKRALIACLDMNHLYVNCSELDDAEYAISNNDKTLTKIFYGETNE